MTDDKADAIAREILAKWPSPVHSTKYHTLAEAYLELKGWFDHLQRKVAHGCTDARCTECDE